MRKILICVLLTTFGITHSQVTFKPGIQAGVNISNVQNMNLGTKKDFYIGAFGALKLSKFYTLQPELTYSRQGANGMISGYYLQTSQGYTDVIYENRNASISLQYISDVTINKFNIYKGFYVVVGPFFDILVGSDFKYDKKNDFTSNVSKGEDVDFGIIGGLGFSLPKGVSFEARIKKGTRNTIENYTSSGFVSGTNTNLVYQFGATYTFDVK